LRYNLYRFSTTAVRTQPDPAAKQTLAKAFRASNLYFFTIPMSNTFNMKTVPVMIIALAAMSTPAAAFTPRVLHKQTASRIFGLGAIPDGWVGGFPESKPAYAYPQLKPDLSDLPILDNMDNIDSLTRQQKVRWPQFSWLSTPGDASSRVYQMFAPIFRGSVTMTKVASTRLFVPNKVFIRHCSEL
jgi:hypothetical protein